ncbi:molybdate ABC transporter substrate-binding protein [Berryella intestinalis]|uniref:Molybdate ABC transporter substrate-binding protein n=1 Tax=Berryella intestinalis TaxID=1531429 RepID=A0A0A8B5E4_9ACTN|nr:molybdate ABC transporter substrate-binding protein [Berryella intestinalis]AJC12605.1 molybdate ABC transporter substrate-binding protein [Berryella intestinalis]
MKKRALVAVACSVALAGALALTGCAGTGSSAGSSDQKSDSSAQPVQLTVFAANSLEKALPEVQALYTAKTGVTFADTQFKASGDLVSQLQADSKAADVLITASTATMDTAVSNKSVDESTRLDMFKNDLVLVAASGSGIKVSSVADLAGDSISSFALGEPNAVPAGKYAVQSLEAAGLCTTATDDAKKISVTWADTVASKVNAGADKVGTVAKYVASGQAQVGFVYSSDVYRYDGIEAIFTVPADTHKAIKYPGAVCADTANSQAAADFLKFCMEDVEAQKVFSKYGFELAA